MLELYLPAAQFEHDDCPVDDWYWPAAQLMHEECVWPEPDRYFPVWHEEQLVPDRYWPDEQVLAVQSCSCAHCIL